MLASLILFLCPFDAGPVIEIPAGPAIKLDGKIEAEEWQPSFSVSRPVGDNRKLRLHMRRSGPWLSVGLTAGRAYAGEMLRIVVADDAGSWISFLLLPIGQPHMPPALWRRGAPGAMADPRTRPESPRAVRARVHVGGAEGWSAEYAVRLSALGIGHGDKRRLRMHLLLFRPGSAEVDYISLPPGAKTILDTKSFARLQATDGWGEGESWPPVSPEVSREFDDHALLHRLFMEHDRIAQRIAPEEFVISTAVRPRSEARVNALRRLLEDGRRRNPSLPSWNYFIARLLHEANYFKEAHTLLEAVPTPLAKLAPYVNLRAEHFNDTEEPKRAIEVIRGRTDVPRFRETVVTANRIIAGLDAERKAQEADRKRRAQNPRVRIMTAKGDIVCELFEDDAPLAVRNFIDLVEQKKFYDRLTFDEVIGGQIARTGDPRTRPGTSTRADNPGWRLKPDKPARPLLRGRLVTVPGQSGAFHGSAFFISTVPLPMETALVVFGRVVSGMDVVDRLEQDDRIDRIEVISKRNHVYDASSSRLR